MLRFTDYVGERILPMSIEHATAMEKAGMNIAGLMLDCMKSQRMTR